VSKEVRDILIKAGIALTAFLGTTLSTVAVKLIPPETLNKLDALTWARLVVSTSLLSVSLIAWVMYLLYKNKKKPDFKPYAHKPEKGYWQHKMTEEKICAACKLDDVLSPLHVYRDGWRCPKHPITVGKDIIESEPPTAPNYHMIYKMGILC